MEWLFVNCNIGRMLGIFADGGPGANSPEESQLITELTSGVTDLTNQVALWRGELRSGGTIEVGQCAVAATSNVVKANFGDGPLRDASAADLADTLKRGLAWVEVQAGQDLHRDLLDRLTMWQSQDSTKQIIGLATEWLKTKDIKLIGKFATQWKVRPSAADAALVREHPQLFQMVTEWAGTTSVDTTYSKEVTSFITGFISDASKDPDDMAWRILAVAANEYRLAESDGNAAKVEMMDSANGKRHVLAFAKKHRATTNATAKEVSLKDGWLQRNYRSMSNILQRHAADTGYSNLKDSAVALVQVHFQELAPKAHVAEQIAGGDDAGKHRADSWTNGSSILTRYKKTLGTRNHGQIKAESDALAAVRLRLTSQDYRQPRMQECTNHSMGFMLVINPAISSDSPPLAFSCLRRECRHIRLVATTLPACNLTDRPCDSGIERDRGPRQCSLT